MWQYAGDAPVTDGHRTHWSVVGPPDDHAWVAPESAPTAEADPTQVVAPPVPSPRAVAAAPGVDAPIRLPAPLRPMTIGDLLDGGFNTLRTRPRMVLGLAAVFVIPTQLVVAFINRNAIEDLQNALDALAAGVTSDSGPDPFWLPYVGMALQSLAQALVAGALALLVIAWYSDEQPDGREVLRRLGPRLPVLTLAWLVALACKASAAIAGFGVGGLALMALFIVVVPIVVIERTGPFAALSRSTSLTGRRFWPVLGFGLLSALVTGLLGLVLSSIPQLLGYLIGDDFGWIVLGVGGIINQMIGTTIVGAATALLYLDLRIRREGMDVAWGTARLFPA